MRTSLRSCFVRKSKWTDSGQMTPCSLHGPHRHFIVTCEKRIGRRFRGSHMPSTCRRRTRETARETFGISDLIAAAPARVKAAEVANRVCFPLWYTLNVSGPPPAAVRHVVYRPRPRHLSRSAVVLGVKTSRARRVQLVAPLWPYAVRPPEGRFEPPFWRGRMWRLLMTPRGICP